MFTGGVSRLIDTWMSFRTLRVQAERLADIVLTEPERDAPVDAPPLPEARPLSIRVSALRYRFEPQGPWAVSYTHLDVYKRQTRRRSRATAAPSPIPAPPPTAAP